MKKIIAALTAGIILATAFGVYAQTAVSDISSSLVRLHIVANSDSAQDQQVKLKVRDAVIEAMSEKFSNTTSPEEAERIVSENIPTIRQIANRVLKEEGFDYRATAQLGNFEFPVKQYANLTLPAGRYDALRIVLGEGGGHNWWCVMFPPLCFVSDAKGEVPDESQEILKQNLTPDSYDIITADDESELPVVFKFKLLELWHDMSSGISSQN